MFHTAQLNDRLVITAYGSVGGWIDHYSMSSVFGEAQRMGLKKIDLHMHTTGGSVFEGNLLYNLIQSFNGEVDIYVDGIAASMGALLAISGTRLYMAENGFLMLHPPKGNVTGTAQDMLNAAKMLRSMQNNFVQKVANKVKKTEKAVASDYFDGGDHWIDADEAIALGLATDKFTALKGEIKYSKDDAVKVGLDSLYTQYTANLTETQKPEPMKQVLMKLNLSAEAQETEAVAAIANMEQRLQAAEAKLQTYRDAEATARKNEAKQLIATAQTEQRIEASAAAAWETAFEKDFDTAKAMLAGIPKRATAQQVIEGAQDIAADLAKMSWDELDKANKLPELKAKSPDLFKEKYKAKFGTEPKM
jgi:ATP-dependent protease ClpP protease subunit